MPVPRSDAVLRRPPGVRRAALLELLRAHDDGLTVADLAPLAGLHPNTVRAHLEVLVRSGQAVRRTYTRGTRGRPRELYQATGAPAGDTSYRLLAEVLAARLAELGADPAAQGLEAGRLWARRDRSLGPAATPTTPAEALIPVLTMLRISGFAPELAPDGSTIRLHHCPFRELAEAQPEIVCATHLGLIRGALERSGAPVRATRILPFVEPDLCLTELDGPGRVEATSDDRDTP